MTDNFKTMIDALNYVKSFAGQLILIKLGGSILDDKKLVEVLCQDLSLLRATGVRVVIVHGGGKAINEELTAHGISWEFHQGQRVTTPDMIDLIEMVLCGRVNKMLVRCLNAHGVPAVGLSGPDKKMLECSRQQPELGEVGHIDRVNTSLIEDYLTAQQDERYAPIPVIAPIGMDQEGNALNINADWAATCIAQALDIQKLVYLTDQDGIYDKNGKLLSVLDTSQLMDLVADNTVQGGMLIKVNTILDALNQGIDNIHILNARQPHALIRELFTEQGVGTLCKKRAV